MRTQNGRYLDPWYNRLRDAYVDTMAHMGVTTDLQGQEFLEAMARRKQVDPTMALLETAIKATAKGATGKLRQRSRGQVPYYEPYPALNRETWRPDIGAAVLAAQRVGLHHKLMKTAAAADLYPVAIGTDAIVYPSPGPSPLDVLPHTPEGKPAPGTFRLGVSPGMVKHQGTQTVLWAEAQFEERGGVFNVANLIKCRLAIRMPLSHWSWPLPGPWDTDVRRASCPIAFKLSDSHPSSFVLADSHRVTY
ncbi:hypothetical protein ACFYWU_34450 [Streptomyces chrestomyceticus]|uniref:hypothetical protein n=1 Tax=Streptomyces chrestomyceticus TaxID=68185 RepID=UPI00369728EB